MASWLPWGPAAEERRQRARARREGTLLVREARRAMRRYGHRLTPDGAATVRDALEALDTALQRNARDPSAPLAAELNALDKALDDYLPFARKSTVREYTESIAVAVLIALFLRAFVVEAFKIPSGSMIPTLEVGDHIFVNKFIYGVRVPFTDIKFGMKYREPKRGEVIVFKFPQEPDKDFIKRIVAVGGDTVEVKDNVLTVNGKPVERHHVDGDCRYMDYDENTDTWEERRCDRWDETLDGHTYTTYFNYNRAPGSYGPWTVPPDSVFVMGDNRDNSHDSRFWQKTRFVPYDLIKGQAMVIWWSSGQPEGFVRLRRLFHLVK